jgi:RNA polymerase sigma-70 factor (ECF subfamily)
MSDSGRMAEDSFRTDSVRVLGALMRRFGNLDLAEDAFQDACLAAVETWPEQGVPLNPGAWLTTVAGNAALDRIRREAKRLPKEAEAAGLRATGFGAGTGFERYAGVPNEPVSPGPDTEYDLSLLDDGPLTDDQLRLVFLCCHPALSVEAQIALTLRTVGGLTTPEIARAFLVAETTMAQRLVRAKRKIVLAGIPFRLPEGDEFVARTASVLHVVYLIFNEGYAASGTDTVVRTDLCLEAVRLASLLERLLPQDAEVLGLHALLLLHDARRASRVDGRGRLVPLDEQDREQWNADQVRVGVGLVERALAIGPIGPYQLQAAIAALHAEAPSPGETDWAQIVELYRLLEHFAPGPLVALNSAVAVAMAQGPGLGLALLDELAAAGELPGHHRLPSARAQLLERLGRREEALAAYEDALALVGNVPERTYLTERRNRLADST